MHIKRSLSLHFYLTFTRKCEHVPGAGHYTPCERGHLSTTSATWNSDSGWHMGKQRNSWSMEKAVTYMHARRRKDITLNIC